MLQKLTLGQAATHENPVTVVSSPDRLSRVSLDCAGLPLYVTGCNRRNEELSRQRLQGRADWAAASEDRNLPLARLTSVSRL